MRKRFMRYHFLGISLSVFAVVIAVQMVRIQSSTHADYLNDWAKDYGYELRTIESERGYIYDRYGHLLAGNKEVYEVGIELQFVRNPSAIASTLANVLGLDYQEVFNAANTKYVPGQQVYVTLADFVESYKIKEINDLKTQFENNNPYGLDTALPSLRGLTWTAHLRRIYPEGNLAANILGFFTYYDREGGAGYFGVEEKYNTLLAGIKRNVVIPLDPYELQEIPTAPAGASLVLTIDREMQRTVEGILDKAVKTNGAAGGTIIVMDPNNGEILAMASNPRLDPNAYWENTKVFPPGVPYNKAVNQVYEPGSVFKILTMAAALDAGVVTSDTPFTDTGQIEVGGWMIYNWDRGAWGNQNMIGCMQHSLNVCLSWIATQLGPTRFYDYLERFGIGHRTNIDLAGEEVYPLSVPGDPMWYTVNLATNSFGQGVAVTPVQLLMAASAIANEGQMVAPHVLKSYIQDGQQFDTAPQVVGRPITAETAKTLTDMLAISLEEEASTALVDGYRVAGKTGTAEIAVNGQYSSNKTNASFVGWGPVDDPQFIVFVWLEKPSTSIWGSIVAAPVFSNVVQEIVVLMNLPPDEIRMSLKEE
ncbi:MAG TPA: penicillin-binding protein 2 [Anaerolineaceae bacterium]|nr:penicillin-binding protein 2 [Anaerolineaceae bacterium]HQF68524.1 penicillin-binding protein 2 [Anaerolineaceae bacterium]HRT92062.1 penicillin-binding protein 2 [Anaerolineaceae bacterium]HUM63616.1 penicillin-binding protein 2 [Anaerolineaceae bacterium]